MKQRLLSWMLAGAIGAATSAAWAEPGGWEGMHPPCGPEKRGFHHLGFGERMAERLGLTPEQREQIEKIRAQAREAGKSLREALREAKRKEREAWLAGASERELKKRAREVADKRVEWMLHGKNVRERIEAVLTPEQREQLAALRAERMERWRERREHQGHTPPPGPKPQ
ncbi:MAG: hypothetical protein KatS3mg124_2363 [Porticoccaceae bacterium]|nr:MAG: hypothetical protein KatS3mg124_2363 [Porticoccaceae bacterium]